MIAGNQGARCARCQSRLHSLECGGLCAKCLARGILADDSGLTEPEPEPLIRFDQLTLIGSGGMGAVFAAYDRRLRRSVALKFLHADLLSNPAARLRFELETLISSQLEHPGVIPIYDVGKDVEGRPFYVMRRIRGSTLAHTLEALLKGEPAALEQYSLIRLLSIFNRLCEAMAHAHSRGIIHRDLKPANVMLGEFGEVFVMDWGLAKALSNPVAANLGEKEAFFSEMASFGQEHMLRLATIAPETNANALLGTPGFMAPEQAEGNGHAADQRTDIYALGAILYNILTLRPPISGGEDHSILRRTARGQIVHPCEYQSRKWFARDDGLPHCPGGRFPAGLADAAMKALAQTPGTRFQRVNELQEAVGRCLPRQSRKSL